MVIDLISVGDAIGADNLLGIKNIQHIGELPHLVGTEPSIIKIRTHDRLEILYKVKEDSFYLGGTLLINVSLYKKLTKDFVRDIQISNLLD